MPPEQNQEFGDAVIRKIILHLIPFILILYIVNYIDRVNLGFAAWFYLINSPDDASWLSKPVW